MLRHTVSHQQGVSRRGGDQPTRNVRSCWCSTLCVQPNPSNLTSTAIDAMWPASSDIDSILSAISVRHPWADRLTLHSHRREVLQRPHNMHQTKRASKDQSVIKSSRRSQGVTAKLSCGCFTLHPSSMLRSSKYSYRHTLDCFLYFTTRMYARMNAKPGFSVRTLGP